MQTRLSIRRWFTFSIAAAVLLTGLILLSAEAAGTGLAPTPDPDESTAKTSTGSTPNTDGTPVVDRLNTWAETGKSKTSHAKGGGKHK
ncbi:MAG TPA: hypothetical protein VHR66_27225 [Gemmataceae bacterium]|nr:hypothetical protein [Gemmataceae bacterium]